MPNPRVEFTGRPRRETAWEAERENLPPEVRPGETYRDIGITLHIRSVFADIDRIVAEAPGEIPGSDDTLPAPPPRPQPPATNAPPADSTTPPAQAPADATIDDVDLTLRGVRAEALLKVRLDNVAAIIDRTLTTIDRNPQILERLLQTVDSTVGTVGGVANTALQPGVVVDRTVGNVTSLTRQGTDTTNASGQTVRRVLDTTGAVIELTRAAAGRVVNSRVVSQATGRP